MTANKLFALIQSRQSVRNNQFIQPLHNKNATMQNYKPASVQSCESLAQTSLIRRSFAKIDRLWKALVKCAETTPEPKVTWMRDRHGHSYFKIYDPVTGRHHYAYSEQEARIWLERSRYYQPGNKRECIG